MSNKTILVTGAGGNIGRELLMLLIRSPHDYNIRIFDVPSLKNKEFFDRFHNRVKTFWGDISNKYDSIDACKDVDVVIHLAAIIPPLAYERPDLVESVNVLGTRNLIENLEVYSPNALLCFSSSVAVYGDRVDDPYIKVGDPLQASLDDNYAESKIEIEKMVQESKLQWTIFRLSAIFGVGNHKISPLMFAMPLATPMEITTPRDTAQAFVNAIEHREELVGRIFNLGGGRKMTPIYEDFLRAQFRLAGLGDLDFPIQAFATQNYHCGIYEDGDELENILHFRRDTLRSLYREIAKAHPWPLRLLTKASSRIIKKWLLSKSDPYKGWVDKDAYKLYKYFGIDIREQMIGAMSNKKKE